MNRSFIMGGWSGHCLYFQGWLNFNLGVIRVFLLGLIYLSEINVVVRGYAAITVFFTILFFRSHGVLLIYVIFEILTLPVVILLYIYGSQPEKVGALYYILRYTGRFGISFIYIIITLESWDSFISPLLSIYILGIFAVKCPIFGLHLWLPKAHVEAPTTARMLLAGLLLKVGVYGVLKVVSYVNLSWFWVMILSFMGYILAPILSILSRDTKQLVAYSSVTHINLILNRLVFCCLRLNTSSYLISLSHGYISSIIFFIIGEMYHSGGSRMIYYSGGLYGLSGFIIFVRGVVIFANAGVPPFLSFWGELLVVGRLTRFEILFLVSIIVYFILSFYYSVFLTIRISKRVGVKNYYIYIRIVVFSGIFPFLMVLIYIV